VAEGDGDRVPTAHQHTLDQRLAAIRVARHSGSLPVVPRSTENRLEPVSRFI
jgi:hypothetical protein